MTADTFDPEEIARRVFDAEQAAIATHDPTPLARSQGMTVTGGGDSRGRPLPTEPVGRADDIFDRLERQREAKAVRSPFGPPDQRTVTQPTTAARVERKVDEQRFVAPPVDVATEPAPELVVALDAATPVDSPRSMDHEPRPEPEHDPRCGQLLTGGGAPRGWVLVRIIGAGQPRRYCGPKCAVDALTATAGPDGTVQPRTDSVRRKVTDAEVAEMVRRYKAGQSLSEIAKAVGRTKNSVHSALATRGGIVFRPRGGAHPRHTEGAQQ